MGRHSIRGVLTGEELNVVGKHSDRPKKHRQGEPHDLNDEWAKFQKEFIESLGGTNGMGGTAIDLNWSSRPNSYGDNNA